MIVDQNQLQVLQVKNQLPPVEGPKAIPVRLDFTASGDYLIELELLQQRAFISQIQCLYVDAFNLAVDLTITVSNSLQTIVCKKGTQGYYPVLVTNPPQFICSSQSGNAIATVILLNIPIPGCVW